MPRMQIAFIDGPVSVVCHLVRRALSRSPEVGNHPIQIVYRFDSRVLEWPVGAAQQYRARAEKRLDIVFHVAESLPNQARDTALAAKVREWRLQRLIAHIVLLLKGYFMNRSQVVMR
jgi:hypothetical protein